MWLFRGRQLRAGRGRRLDRSEREFIHWASTRDQAPASAEALAEVFAVHISSIYRARVDMAKVARDDAEWQARREAARLAARARSTMHVAHDARVAG